MENVNVWFVFFIIGDGFVVGDDFYFEFVIFDDVFDGFDVYLDVVGVEVFEFFDGFEFVDMFFGDLGDFEKVDVVFVVNDGIIFDIGFGFVG